MRFPSSNVESPPAEEPLLALVSEELQKLPPGVHVELGPNLPAFYEVNRLVLMIQDPFHVFAYWETTQNLKAQVLSRFPEEDRPGFQLVLDWVQVESGQRTTFDLGTVTSWWLEADPGFHYQARLCFYSELYGASTLLESNIVETPKYSIGPSDPLAAEDQDATNWLHDLLELTSVARKTMENDSSREEPGRATLQLAVSEGARDRPTWGGQARVDASDSPSGHNSLPPHSWPTS